MRILLVMLMLIPAISQASDWSQADTNRQLAFTGVVVLDWAQTRYMAKHPCDPTYRSRTGCVNEDNPMLGKYPTLGRVDVYFTSAIIMHPIIAYLLPKGWREGFQYVSIGIESGAVYGNWKLGVGMSF